MLRYVGFIGGYGMSKNLKIDVITEKMQSLGINQSGLADKLAVDRQLVSAWLKSGVFPRPDKLLRLGVALELSFKDLVQNTTPEVAPIISFRQKQNRNETKENKDDAIQKGLLLKHLDEHLAPLNPIAPISLSSPSVEYEYIQYAASTVQQYLGIKKNASVSGDQLIAFFNQLHIVVIPVMWGDKNHYANGLNIFIPGSNMTYIYLNIDSNVLDLNFWMAHELGHTLAAGLCESSKEFFADTFAEALLFPQEEMKKTRQKIRTLSSSQDKITEILRIAKKRNISPTTITKSIHRYESVNNLEETTFPKSIHGATTNLNKTLGTISKELFKDLKEEPTPSQYIKLTSGKFKTSFFNALKKYCLRNPDEAVSYIHQVLESPLADSLAILYAFQGGDA